MQGIALLGVFLRITRLPSAIHFRRTGS